MAGTPVAALIVRVAADLADLKTSVGDITGTLGKAETSAQTAGKAILAAFSAAQIIGFAKDATASFAEEEAALQKLTTALVAQGNATPKVIDDFARMAGTFQRTTTFSDELIIEMEALLVQVGNVAPGQMQAALTAATNLAAGLGVDLRTATMLVGKAFEGETGTLKRYGIVIDESKLKGEGITAVLEAINQKFGGQAQAAVETHTGKMKQFSNQIDEVKERVGNAIATVLSPLLDLFLNLPETVQSVITVLGGLVSAATPVIWAFGGSGGLLAVWQAIAPYLGPVGIIGAGIVSWFTVFKNLDVFVWAAVTAWQAFKDKLAQTGTELVDVSKRTYEGIKTWLLDKFTAVVDGIKAKVDAVSGFFKDMYEKVVGGSYVPDMVEGIRAEFGKLGDIFDAFIGLGLDRLMGSIERAFGPQAANAVQKLNQIMSDGMQAASGIMRVFAGDFSGLIDAVVGGVNFVKGLMSSLGGIFSDPGRDTVQAFGKQYGGLDELHKVLQANLPDAEAERLWINLTQRVGRNDRGAAQAAIDEILRALGGGFTGGYGPILDAGGGSVFPGSDSGTTMQSEIVIQIGDEIVGRAANNYLLNQYKNQMKVSFA